MASCIKNKNLKIFIPIFKGMYIILKIGTYPPLALQTKAVGCHCPTI